MTAITQTTAPAARRFRLRGPHVPGAAVTRHDAAVLSATALLNVLGLALPLVTLHVYDKILPNQGYETLTLMTLGLFMVALLEFALRALQSMVLAPSATHYAQELKREALTRHLVSGLDEEAARRSAPDLFERLVTIDRFAAFYGGTARQALIDLPFALLALGMIALIGGPLVFAPLTVVAVYLAALAICGARIADKAREKRVSEVKSNDFLHET
ncbi:MAG: ABC transporter transmembrane domain-containing protein, partial [Pseudomonadota bacterium]